MHRTAEAQVHCIRARPPPVFDREFRIVHPSSGLESRSSLQFSCPSGFCYNGQIPGPRIRVSQGDHVRILVHSQLPESTTVHWHGLILPDKMDGPAFITQDPIRTGDSYSYEFTDQAGTFFYHSHDHPDRQQALGLYGAFIIDPREPENVESEDDLEYVIQLQEWLVREGLTYPAMLTEGALPNYFTINGRAYPSTE
jgi:FtsP/CotA-like multicopper oxidase with cupredoxin domain